MQAQRDIALQPYLVVYKLNAEDAGGRDALAE